MKTMEKIKKLTQKTASRKIKRKKMETLISNKVKNTNSSTMKAKMKNQPQT